MRVERPDRQDARAPFFSGGGVPFLVFAYLFGELFVFSLVSDRVGFLLAFALAIGKSVLGAAAVSALLRQSLATWRRNGGPSGGIRLGAIGPKLAGAIFLILPGFLSGVIGLALLTPSIRALFSQPAPVTARDGIVELNEHEWREISAEQGDRRLRDDLPH